MQKQLQNKYTLLLVSLIFSVVSVFAQENLSNQRIKQISILRDTTQIDSLSIVPNSFEYVSKIDSSNFKIDLINAQLIRVNSSEKDGEKVTVKYRVYPYNFGKSKQSASIYTDSLYKDVLIVGSPSKENDQLFDFGNLDVQGGLGRALNFGNNQNLVVNSNLNLRLSGELSNGITVAGVITDDNVPFQPQGNSRQIRELDKVFLQFKKDHHEIILGDYEQSTPNSYFLNYNKRLQGVNYRGDFLKGNSWKLNTMVSGAVSRGKYVQNTFVGKEGNQGPYKLHGANNETYLIILAGTERVYINNILMQRGEDRDYIIDYNIGEIIFTNNKFITNRSRISVEFEYTNQNYNSTFLHSETNYGNEKINFRVNVYTEQDSKKKLNIGDSTLNTSNLFQNLGDNSDAFYIDNIQEQDYDENKVQYKIEPTIVIDGVTYKNVYVASTNPNDKLYSVSFTYVGDSLGSYQLEEKLINGRQFKFVGTSKGDYVAKLRVQPPRQQQLLSFTTEYRPRKNQHITFENSISNKDLNTLSTLGNNDNKGFASHISWKSFYRLTPKDSLKHIFNTAVNFELKQRNFRAIERYRPVEFERNWNADINSSDSFGEQYGNILLSYLPNKFHKIDYKFSTFLQENSYTGFKNFGAYTWRQNGYNVELNYDYLTTNESTISSTFSKPSYLVSKRINHLKGLKIGSWGSENLRKFSSNETELLNNNSIGDRDIRVFIETNDTSKFQTKLSFGKRYDYTPYEKKLVDLFETNVIELEGNLNQVKNHQLGWNLTYRDLIVQNENLTDETNKTSFLGRTNYIGTFANGVIRTGLDYQVGAGQEPKREFSFIKVSSGEGQYIWVDYNGNDKQEITEFELAPFTDQGEYVRVFTSSNEYLSATSTQINQWISMTPAIAWKQEEKMKGFLSKFELNSRMILKRKLYEDSPESRFNPYIFDLDNEGLLSVNNRFTNRILFNKLSNKFRLSYLHNVSKSKVQLLSGFENRAIEQHTFNQQIYFKNKFSILNDFGYTNQAFLAENYANKNFNFKRYYFHPKLNFVANNSLRIVLGYEYGTSKNKESLNGETALNNALDFNFNWNKKKQFSFKGSFNYNNIDFSGDNSSAVRFSMLNGLQTGRNSIWNLNFEREVAKAVKFNLIYDGRQLGDLDPVHTGRLRVTAIFN